MALPNEPLMKVLIPFFFVVPAVFSAYLADAKKRNPTTWGILGLVFGIFALITIAGLPEGEASAESSREARPAPDAKAWNPLLGPPE